MTVQAFSSPTALTPSGGTSRYNGGTNTNLAIRDATTSTTFSVTTSSGVGGWGGIGLRLVPTAAQGLYLKGIHLWVATTITLPVHAIGDDIFVAAYRADANTVITQPTASGTVPAWLTIDANTGADTNSMRTAHVIATATNTTSGTWTGAGFLVAWVMSGQGGVPIGGHAESGSTSTSGATAPSITQSVTSGRAKIFHVLGRRNNSMTSWNTPPAGYTSLVNTSRSGTGLALIAKDDTTSDGSVTLGSDGNLSNGYRGASIEVIPRVPGVVEYVDAAAAAATSVTLPPHQIGDTIVIGVWRANNTLATKPAAGGTVPTWIDIDASTGANNGSMRTAYFIATATNHTSGTWTNATRIAVTVLRGQGASPVGGHAESGGGSGGTDITAPSVTMTRTDGTSQILEFHGGSTASAITYSGAPTGYTRRALGVSAAEGIALNTKDNTTSDGSVNQVVTGQTLTAYRGATVEIVADVAASYEENTTHYVAPVPLGVTGCYVTLIGGGGAGATGTAGINTPGGGGGGGGGGIQRVWIPARSLGATYSVVRGLGGTTSAANGTASTFSSGGVSLSGGGGLGPTTTAAAGAGGTCSVSGVTATTTNGANGGAGDTTSGAGLAGTGGNSTGIAGAGGGGGAEQHQANAAAAGGNSATVTGGAGGGNSAAGGSPAAAAAGAGGAGAGGGGGGWF
mgnify:FL=1